VALKTITNNLLDDTLLIVSAGNPYLALAKSQLLDLQRHTKGINGFLITPPEYIKPDQESIKNYYNDLLALVDESRFTIIYEVPSRTGVEMIGETCISIMRNDKVIGIKFASDNTETFNYIIANKKEGSLVFCGDDLKLDSMVLGGDGFIGGAQAIISVVGNALAEELTNHMELILEGNRGEFFTKYYTEYLHYLLYLYGNPKGIITLCFILLDIYKLPSAGPTLGISKQKFIDDMIAVVEEWKDYD